MININDPISRALLKIEELISMNNDFIEKLRSDKKLREFIGKLLAVYVLQNWKSFAFVDDCMSCAIKLNMLPVVRTLMYNKTGRSESAITGIIYSIMSSMYSMLRELGFRVETRKSGRGISRPRYIRFMWEKLISWLTQS